MKKLSALTLVIILALCVLASTAGCSKQSADNKVLIYHSSEDYRVQYFIGELKAKFPNYDIQFEYLSSGDHVARIVSESKSTLCDITFDLEYGYAPKAEPFLADLSKYDFSKYSVDAVLPSHKLLPELRLGGCIAINTSMLQAKGLAVPNSYEDLLKPEYKSLISMPNPKSSGTGYIFLKSLVNAWGEDRAFEYFGNLSKNVLHFTTSGMGPINDIVAGEAAIGLAMTPQAVTEINKGVNIEVRFFTEGSPFTFYGIGIIDGKQNKKAVQEVFDYFIDVLVEKDKELYYPEKIYKDKDFDIENYPKNINYADMSGNTSEEKTRLLDKWEY